MGPFSNGTEAPALLPFSAELGRSGEFGRSGELNRGSWGVVWVEDCVIQEDKDVDKMRMRWMYFQLHHT